jgi:mRNA interferase MazF
VTILDERPSERRAETALLSEAALAEDWERPKERRGVEAPAKGAVVLVRFPFSDLSGTKLSPAVVLADAGRGDRVLCQVTSKPYGDSAAVVTDDTAFASGSLRVTSDARPGKLFTASSDLMTEEVGLLTPEAQTRIVDAVVALIRDEAPTASEPDLR